MLLSTIVNTNFKYVLNEMKNEMPAMAFEPLRKSRKRYFRKLFLGFGKYCCSIFGPKCIYPPPPDNLRDVHPLPCPSLTSQTTLINLIVPRYPIFPRLPRFRIWPMSTRKHGTLGSLGNLGTHLFAKYHETILGQ